MTYNLNNVGERGYLITYNGKENNLFATCLPMTDIKEIQQEIDSFNQIAENKEVELRRGKEEIESELIETDRYNQNIIRIYNQNLQT